MGGEIIIDGVKYMTYTGMLEEAERLIGLYNQSPGRKEKVLGEIRELYAIFAQRQKGLGMGTFPALDAMKQKLEVLLAIDE
jgi:hypothetical protein